MYLCSYSLIAHRKLRNSGSFYVDVGGLIYFLFNFSIFIWWFCEQDLLLGLKGECFVTAMILVIIPEFQGFSSYSSVLLAALQFFKMTPENSELGPKMLQLKIQYQGKKRHHRLAKNSRKSSDYMILKVHFLLSKICLSNF